MKKNIDPGLFSQEWFRKMVDPYRLFWVYLITECDEVGVWEVDTEIASVRLRCPEKALVYDALPDVLKQRVKPLTASKWIIVKYVKFQYGILNPASKAHRHVIQKVLDYGLDAQALSNEMLLPIRKAGMAIDRLSIGVDASPNQESPSPSDSLSVAYPKSIDNTKAKQSKAKQSFGGGPGEIDPTLWRPIGAPTTEKEAGQMAKNFGVDPDFAIDIYRQLDCTEWKDAGGRRITQFAAYVNRRWNTPEKAKWQAERGKTSAAQVARHETDPVWEHVYRIEEDCRRGVPGEREITLWRKWYRDFTPEQVKFLTLHAPEIAERLREGVDSTRKGKTS